MPERRVLRMGNPDLLRVSQPVGDFQSPKLAALIEDLWDTVVARGGVGLAAPQIGVPLRVVVFGVQNNSLGEERPPVLRTVLVNPVIEPLSDERVEGWEGCLSVPGLRGRVSRWACIRYRGQDAAGEPIVREVEGFHSRLVQHEYDHLDGILYPQRMTDLRDLGFEEEVSLAGKLSAAERFD